MFLRFIFAPYIAHTFTYSSAPNISGNKNGNNFANNEKTFITQFQERALAAPAFTNAHDMIMMRKNKVIYLPKYEKNRQLKVAGNTPIFTKTLFVAL